jgi:predicted dehydrogenase
MNMNKADEYFRMGMIGCGGISHTHARAISEDAHAIRFISCCSRNKQRARAWAEEYNCTSYYTDYVEMCKKELLDGVLLATWPAQHYDQLRQIIDAGVKNILCEKSLTMSGHEAAEIYEYAGKHGVFLMEGFMYRHSPAIRQIEAMLAERAAGQVDNVRAVFSFFEHEAIPAEDLDRNWRLRQECGGGVVYDLVCYCVNAISHFCGGRPVQVYAVGSMSPKYNVENRLFGLVQYDNGCIGIIESSKKSLQSQELQISCEKMIINLPVAWTINQASEIKVINNREWAQASFDVCPVPWENSYRLQLFDFVKAACGIDKPLLPLSESVMNTYIIEALVRSLHEGRPNPIEEENSHGNYAF